MLRPSVTTKRCALGLPEEREAPELVRFYMENREHLSPWEPETPPGFYTEEYWLRKIRAARSEFEKEISLRFHIRLAENNTLIGMANFTALERGPFQNCRLGYKLDHRHLGRGLMTEALGGAIAYVFGELNFHRIEANYIPENEKSGEVLKRLGFQVHGTAEDYLRIAGRWQKHVLTSLTNPGWRPGGGAS